MRKVGVLFSAALLVLTSLCEPVIFAPKPYVDSKYEAATNFAAAAAADARTDAVAEVEAIGYIKSDDVEAKISDKVSDATNGLVSVSDLVSATNTIADAIPTKVSELENDSGYIYEEKDPEFVLWKTNAFLTAGRDATVHSNPEYGSIAFGDKANAKGSYSVAIGKGATASKSYSTAIGNSAEASAFWSTAYGGNSAATYQYALAVGYGARAQGDNAVSVGRDPRASSDSVAIGNSAKASVRYGVAVGSSATVAGDSTFVGDYGVSVGYKAYALGKGAAFGYQSYAPAGCFAVGYDPSHFLLCSQLSNPVTNSGSTARSLQSYLDEKASTSSVPTKVSELTNDSGFITGETCFNSWMNGTALAAGAESKANTTYNSTAYGYKASATGGHSVAVGDESNASGSYSTAIGYEAAAINTYSTALGGNTKANGEPSLAVGYGAKASGDDSIAIGDGTAWKYSTVIGYGANGNYLNTVALGRNAVSGSDYCTAVGNGSNASGKSSTAIGTSSSAIGGWATAIGYRSFATGNNMGFSYDPSHFYLCSSNTVGSQGSTAKSLQQYLDEKASKSELDSIKSKLAKALTFNEIKATEPDQELTVTLDAMNEFYCTTGIAAKAVIPSAEGEQARKFVLRFQFQPDDSTYIDLIDGDTGAKAKNIWGSGYVIENILSKLPSGVGLFIEVAPNRFGIIPIQ